MTAPELIERCRARGVNVDIGPEGVWVDPDTPKPIALTFWGQQGTLRAHVATTAGADDWQDLVERVAFLKWSVREAAGKRMPRLVDAGIKLPNGSEVFVPGFWLLAMRDNAKALAARHGETGWMGTKAGQEILATWLHIARWWWDETEKMK